MFPRVLGENVIFVITTAAANGILGLSCTRLTVILMGALKSRDLTTRHHIARVDIARLDKAAPD